MGHGRVGTLSVPWHSFLQRRRLRLPCLRYYEQLVVWEHPELEELVLDEVNGVNAWEFPVHGGREQGRPRGWAIGWSSIGRGVLSKRRHDLYGDLSPRKLERRRSLQSASNRSTEALSRNAEELGRESGNNEVDRAWESSEAIKAIAGDRGTSVQKRTLQMLILDKLAT